MKQMEEIISRKFKKPFIVMAIVLIMGVINITAKAYTVTLARTLQYDENIIMNIQTNVKILSYITISIFDGNELWPKDEKTKIGSGWNILDIL